MADSFFALLAAIRKYRVYLIICFIFLLPIVFLVINKTVAGANAGAKDSGKGAVGLKTVKGYKVQGADNATASLATSPVQYIDFSPYLGQTMTTQFQNQGVVFSGGLVESGNPLFWGNPPAKVLNSNSVEITFINPADGTPAEATSITWFVLMSDRVTVTYYDIYGNIILTKDYYWAGELVTPTRCHKFSFVSIGPPFEFGNFSFQMVSVQYL